MTIVLVHLTDLHFGRVDERAVASVSDDIRQFAPHLIAVSGDLTQAARASEFNAAVAFLRGLGAPVLAVPGNHDVSPYRLVERFVDPWRLWRRYVNTTTEPVWEHDDVLVAGLNTARSFALGWDWSKGRVSHRQITNFCERLGKGGPVRVVVAHHPLLLQPGLPPDQIARRADAAVKCFTAAGVKLVLTGHMHLASMARAIALASDVTSGGPAGELPFFVQGRSATSTRLRGEPNGYNVIFIDGASWRIESRVWTGTSWTADRTITSAD